MQARDKQIEKNKEKLKKQRNRRHIERQWKGRYNRKKVKEIGHR